MIRRRVAAEPHQEIGTGRLEAFSDGILAVLITITAFELRSPDGPGFHALGQRLPEVLVYILSFTFLGIYWNNHHHLLRAATRINATVMWANLLLLFWLSLIPVLTEWVARYYRSSWPAASYGIVALASAISFIALMRAIIRADVPNSLVARAIGDDRKGKVSIVLYSAGVGFAFVSPWIAYGCYASVSILWFVPDRRLA